ncbi:MAG: cytochrome-c peroxidase [Cytophagales bacterium]
MKKLRLIAIITVLVTLFSFKNDGTEVPTQALKQVFIKDLKLFIISTEKFYNNVKATIDSVDKKQNLKADFINARLAYKRIEYLAEYYAPSTCKIINGPFLDKADEEEPSKEPRKAEGFQAIEDQLFAADTIDKYLLEVLAFRLKFNAERLYPFIASYEFVPQHVWWASRTHFVRIMAMGITGFDSPTAKLSMLEAKTGLNSIKNCWKLYVDDTTKQDWKEINALFAKADIYLSKNKNYDKFDRLEFISQYLNPLYNKGLALQASLQIGFLDGSSAIRPEANTLFETKSWNAHYFQSNKSLNSPNKELKAALGKMLFFDPILSANGKRSCASCHNPQNGFAESMAKSMAMDGKTTIKRNAPTLLNGALQAKLFAEGRSNFLEDQIQDVVFATNELHGNFTEIALQLRKSTEYKKLFAEAFAGNADSEITSFAIMKAIAEYERTLVGFNSRFDRYMGGDKKMMNTSEIRGFNIFTGKGLCASCHFVPLFNGTVPPLYDEGELEVLGVPENPYAKNIKADNDLGRGDITGIPWQNGSFKTPTVRNIELTAPYMHNGAYKTLEDVVDFYNKGGGRGLGLDVPNQTLPFDKLNLSRQEQKDLVAFMKTLTDTTGLTSKPAYLPQIEGFTRKIGGEY